jgi:hypothetical protein
VIVPERVLGFDREKLELLTTHDVEHPGIVAIPKLESACAAAFLSYLVEQQRWTYLELKEQEPGSPLARAADALAKQGLAVRHLADHPTATISLEKGFAAWFDSLNSLRSTLARRMRALARRGELELWTSAGRGAAYLLLDLYLDLERRSWKQARRTLRPLAARWLPQPQVLPASHWGLARDEQGALLLRGHRLETLLERWGSPLHVVDRARLDENLAHFTAADAGAGPACEVFYSYKTNPVPGVLDALHARGAGAEVTSPYELWLALRLNVPPSSIVYNGPGKTDASLTDAVRARIGLINVNSRSELARLGKIAQGLGLKQRTGVRVALPGAVAGQFGERVDDGSALRAVSEALQTKGLELVALHTHWNGELATLEGLDLMLDGLLRFAATLESRLKFEPQILDLGGNLPCPTVSHRSALTAYPLVVKPQTQVLLAPHQKGRIVNGPLELLPAVHDLLRATRHGALLLADDPGAWRPLLQPYIEARGVYSLSGFIDRTGARFVVRAARKVFQRPRRLGVGLCFEEAVVAPALASGLRALCRSVGYHGVFEAEFLEGPYGPQLIDFNPRFYGQLAFDVARGGAAPGAAPAQHAAAGAREPAARQPRSSCCERQMPSPRYCTLNSSPVSHASPAVTRPMAASCSPCPSTEPTVARAFSAPMVNSVAPAMTAESTVAGITLSTANGSSGSSEPTSDEMPTMAPADSERRTGTGASWCSSVIITATQTSGSAVMRSTMRSSSSPSKPFAA